MKGKETVFGEELQFEKGKNIYEFMEAVYQHTHTTVCYPT